MKKPSNAEQKHPIFTRDQLNTIHIVFAQRAIEKRRVAGYETTTPEDKDKFEKWASADEEIANAAMKAFRNT